MTAKLLQPTLSGGEIDPALSARVDLQRYGQSVKTALNVIVRPSGGLEGRGGSLFIGEIKNSAKEVVLLPFEVSETVAFVVELGEFYARFYYDDTLVYSSPGVVHEIVTPWDEDQIKEVRITQSADVMFLVHNRFAPRQIGRITATGFRIDNFDFREGPFRSLNPDEAKKIAFSEATGVVTVTSNFDLFSPLMVGSLLRAEEKAMGNIRPWVQGDRGVFVGAFRRSEGKIYRAVTVPPVPPGTGNFTETGNVRPIHEAGRFWDGPGDQRSIPGGVTWSVGVEWEYVHSGYGIAKILTYVSPTQVTALVQKNIPSGIIGGFGLEDLSWALVGDGVTKTFPVAGASAVSQTQYRVVIAGVPVQSNPNHDAGGGATGGTQRTDRVGNGYYMNP